MTIKMFRSIQLSRAVGLSIGLCCVATIPAQEISFAKWVLPILENNCFECHRATHRDERGKLRKPKAGLRLDGKGWILRGSDDDKVVIPGKPDDSPLYYLTALEPDDGDIMPEEGEPLKKRQTEILRLWIEQGAKFGDWVGAKGPAATDRNIHEPVPVMATPLFDRLGKGKSRLSRSAMQKAVGQKGQIDAVVPGSPLLRVSFRSFEAEIGDAEVAKLRTLGRHVTHLNLSRSAITDRALKTVGGMSLLTRLDLHGTAVTDKGMAALKGLSELRYLNLYDTKITDRALDSLAALEQLEALYLWKTGASEKGIAALRQRLPRTKIVFELDLPEARPASEQRGRGTQRKKRKKI